MAVSGLAAAVVVGSGAVGVGHGGEGPHVADSRQPLVLDPAGQDSTLLPEALVIGADPA
jgi:hypothetical protein